MKQIETNEAINEEVLNQLNAKLAANNFSGSIKIRRQKTNYFIDCKHEISAQTTKETITSFYESMQYKLNIKISHWRMTSNTVNYILLAMLNDDMTMHPVIARSRQMLKDFAANGYKDNNTVHTITEVK